jgi:basic membrane protein A
LKALALLCALVLMALPAMAEGLNICIISSVGVDDGNFVQDCYAGIQEFIASHPDCTVKDIKETDIAQLVPTVEKLAGDYDVFVLPGFYFATIGDIALNNPDKHFIVVDSTIQDSEGNPVSLDNVYTMVFKEQEGGFFAGVAAALSTKSGKVAVVNGMPFASNVNYQFGFMAGVNYANAKYGTSAECVELPSYAGTDLSDNDVGGNYVGSLRDEATGKILGEAQIHEGCDVLFVAAGASGNGVFTAAKEANGVYVIGCDADQYKDGAYGKGNIVLTSALKVMHLNVTRQLEAIYNGTFVGTDALLGVDTDSTGYVSEAGHQQLSEDALGKLAECFDLMKAGQIVPPSDTQYAPNDFPGLN